MDEEDKKLIDRMMAFAEEARKFREKRTGPHPIDEIIGDAKSVSDIQAALLDYVAKNAKKDNQ